MTMPYSGSDDAKLPPAVKRLPKRVREIWVRVFNESYDADDEGPAFRAAWAAARNALKEKQHMSDGQTYKSFAELAAATLHGEKATKTDGGHEYSASAYLIVPDAAKPSTWKVRIEETPGAITRAQLGRAAAALGPSGFRGRTIDASDEDKRKAARKLIMLYREDGADDADIPNYLWDIADMNESDAEPEDEDESEEMEEKAGAPAYVEFKAFEQPDGRTRWTMISSGGFEDRDGEVVSTDFLDSCVAQADKAGNRGPLLIYHIPGSNIGMCDTQVVFGQPGFLVESGLFDDTADGRRAAAYYAEHAKSQGGSIKFLYANRTADGTYLPPGIIIERSVLPRERAAFPWSGLTLEELKMAKQRPEAIAELARVLGEERAAAIVGDLETGAKALADLGVRAKVIEGETEAEAAPEAQPETTEAKAAEPETVAEAEPEPEAAETAESGPGAEEAPAEVAEESKAATTEADNAPADMALVLEPETLAEIAKQVSGLTIEQLMAAITAQVTPLVARLDELHAATKQMSADMETLRQTDDARIAEKVAHLPRATVRYMTRPTQAAREEAKNGDGETQESLLEKGKRALYG